MIPDQSTLLRRALGADAIITGATALLMLLAAPWLGELLGLPEALLRGAGAALVPFTAFLIFLLRRAHIPPAAVWFVVAGNVLWAIDSIALLMTGWVGPTTLGHTFVVFQALVVAGFAEIQYVGLRRLRPA